MHDVGTHEGEPFLIMELLEGETLREALASGPLELTRLLDLSVPVADALDVALKIGFTGGEPLLALPMLRQVIEHVEGTGAPGRKLRWTILTNGLLLDDAALDYLEAHRFRIDLSFDGVEAAQAVKGSGSFDTLDRLLGRIRGRAPTLWASRLKVVFTLSPPSCHAWPNRWPTWCRRV